MVMVNRAFTIVELLIVIIVIAILATVVIVSYNGITTSASNSATITAVEQFTKIIKEYAINNGTYPIDVSYPCIGPTGSTCANVVDSTSACFGAGSASAHSTFNSMLSPYTQTMPNANSGSIPCGGKAYAGAWYKSSADGSSAQITYILNGLQTCPKGVGLATYSSQQQSGNATLCVLNMPAA